MIDSPLVRTDEHTAQTAASWADSVARVMRDYSYELESVARRATYKDPEDAGRYVASMIRAKMHHLAIHAYDFQSCQECGVPGQWHRTDDDHYPQPYIKED